jgi:hypothetical protein
VTMACRAGIAAGGMGRRAATDRHPSAGAGGADLQAVRAGPAVVADSTQQRTGEGLVVPGGSPGRLLAAGHQAGRWPTSGAASSSWTPWTWPSPSPHPTAGLVHHRDHGCQSSWFAFGRRLAASGLVAAMGTVGDALDNASPRACSPPWSASSWTAIPGRPEPACGRRSSTASRSSPTANAATPPSTTTYEQHHTPAAPAASPPCPQKQGNSTHRSPTDKTNHGRAEVSHPGPAVVIS